MGDKKQPQQRKGEKRDKEIEAETPDPHATDPGGNVANQSSTGSDATQAGEGTSTGGGGAAGGTSGN